MKGVKVIFAGQAGFIFETDRGERIGVDLYLSDCCRRYFGFKRLMPYLFDPLKLDLDLLIATHAHYDHFDPDSVPLIMGNGKTRLAGARDVKAEAERLGLDNPSVCYLAPGDVLENGFAKITAMPCDHGSETPHAIGLLIELSGKRIYIAGDTCFREDYFGNPLLKGVDLFIMPINGAFGNMNEAQGAKAASMIRAKLCVPCHFWNFAEHGGDPAKFSAEMKEKYPDLCYMIMRPGESTVLEG